MVCHEVDYRIIGDDIQTVEVELDPEETVIAEAGSMNYMEDGISFEARMGDGSEIENGLFGQLMSAGLGQADRRRLAAGRSWTIDGR